jgi:DNA invertase Pin-like site-specific DNA recombinase
MKIGYARVSTKDQTVALQVDALKKAGCTKVHTEVMSGSRSDRPVLAKLLENLRAGDVLVIWKLDRLGRSLQHLVDLVNDLMARKVGLKSLNDPIDTTTSHGRLTFNLFASLAEFERDVIRERTQAGLSAARARPPRRPSPGDHVPGGIDRLCRGGLVPGREVERHEIAEKLRIAKSTLYTYLRHRGVKIGPYRRPRDTRRLKAAS